MDHEAAAFEAFMLDSTLKSNLPKKGGIPLPKLKTSHIILHEQMPLLCRVGDLCPGLPRSGAALLELPTCKISQNAKTPKNVEFFWTALASFDPFD